MAEVKPWASQIPQMYFNLYKCSLDNQNIGLGLEAEVQLVHLLQLSSKVYGPWDLRKKKKKTMNFQAVWDLSQ